MHASGPADEHFFPPGDATAVYFVIGLPPLFTGAAHETAAMVDAAVATTEVGGPGTVTAVTAPEGAAAIAVDETAAKMAITVRAPAPKERRLFTAALNALALIALTACRSPLGRVPAR